MLKKIWPDGNIEFCEESRMDSEYSLKVLRYLKNISSNIDDKINPNTKIMVDNIFNKEKVDYSYKYMCLTTNILKAKNYAKYFQNVGELNCCILNLYEDIERSGINILDEYKNYIRELQRAKDSEGLVLFVKNLDYNSVCMSEAEEKISFLKLLKTFDEKKDYNIHYHGQNTSDIDIVPLSQVDAKYKEYRMSLKDKLQSLRVYPLRDEEFASEGLKTKLKIFSDYGFLF